MIDDGDSLRRRHDSFLDRCGKYLILKRFRIHMQKIGEAPTKGDPDGSIPPDSSMPGMQCEKPHSAGANRPDGPVWSV
jgi:hypothetical protein